MEPLLCLLLASFQGDASTEIEKSLRNLGSEQVNVRDVATQTLRQHGAAAKSGLEQLADSRDLEVATRARLLLAELTPEGKLGAIAEAVERPGNVRVVFSSRRTYPHATTVKKLEIDGILEGDPREKVELTVGMKGAKKPLKKSSTIASGFMKALAELGTVPTIEAGFDIRNSGIEQEDFLKFLASVKTSHVSFGEKDNTGSSLCYKVSYEPKYDPILSLKKESTVNRSAQLWYDSKTNRPLRLETKSEDEAVVEIFSEWVRK
jgi:hypothetical protein